MLELVLQSVTQIVILIFIFFAFVSETRIASELSEALRRSGERENLRQLSLQINNKRLNSRLKANSMERVEIPADGNCFFRAASLHLNEDAEDLRQNLCHFMERNVENYIQFLNIDPSLSEADKLHVARAKIGVMRQSGQFDSETNDILPLVLAEYCQRRLKIFTSRAKQAVINVKPRSNIMSSVFQPIYLALLAPPLQTGIAENYEGLRESFKT